MMYQPKGLFDSLLQTIDNCLDPLGVDRMFYGGNPYDLTSPPNYFDSLFEGDGNSEASSTDSFFSGF